MRAVFAKRVTALQDARLLIGQSTKTNVFHLREFYYHLHIQNILYRYICILLKNNMPGFINSIALIKYIYGSFLLLLYIMLSCYVSETWFLLQSFTMNYLVGFRGVTPMWTGGRPTWLEIRPNFSPPSRCRSQPW